RGPAPRAGFGPVRRPRRGGAGERARRSSFLPPRVADVDVDRLDDPDEWRKIPPLTKDELRALDTDAFYSAFCIQPPSAAVEFWRSGGATGRPLFYPRTAEDHPYCLLGF